MSMFLNEYSFCLLAIGNFLNILSTLRSFFLTEIVHHSVIETIHI